ncbi:hypothetical protein BSLG_007467 [Batrachochytrium salamandrivorans]|nr:hypothetical protein BSLG_007467 [Batrachochytrium salamandrivorans]
MATVSLPVPGEASILSSSTTPLKSSILVSKSLVSDGPHVSFPRLHHGTPLDAWRKTFVSSSKRRNQILLDTCTTNIADAAKWSTCLASIQDTPYFVVGSGSKTNNMFVFENTATNKLVAAKDYHPPADSLVLRSAFSLPSPIFHMSCIGDMLVTAGPDGLAQVYKVECDEFRNKGKGITHVQECVIGTTLTSSVISPPGALIQSLRLKCIELEPVSYSRAENRTANSGSLSVRRVSAIQGKKVYMYDLPTSTVISSEQPGIYALNTLAYSPHAQFGSLLAVGGHDMHLSMLDTRTVRLNGEQSAASVVWNAADAHTMPILDIKFNPFVPYWVASSDASGVIKVWDIRYSAGPAACITDHFDSVNSIAWSNTHCDIISSASSDRAWRAWSIQPDQLVSAVSTPNMFIGFPGSDWGVSFNPAESSHAVIGSKIIGEHQKNCTAPLVSVVASNTHADTFLSLSAIGEIFSHTIRSDLFEQLSPHRYDDVSARDVETKVYSRNLTDAFQCLTTYLRTERPAGQMTAKHEHELIELVSLKPPLVSLKPSLVSGRNSSDSLAGDAETANISWHSLSAKRTNSRDMVVAFREDLETIGYGLPPQYSDLCRSMSIIDSWTQRQFDLTCLRFKIVDRVLQGDCQAIVEHEKEIYAGMEADPEFLDQDTIQFFTEEVITYSYLKGMTMGLKFGELVADTPKLHFDTLSSTMGLLLFPTIYDTVEWLPDIQTSLAHQPKSIRQAIFSDYVAKVRQMRVVSDKSAPVTPSIPITVYGEASSLTSISPASNLRTQVQILTPESPKLATLQPPLLRVNSAQSPSLSIGSPNKSVVIPSPLPNPSPTRKGTVLDTFKDVYIRKQTHVARVACESKEILPMISLEIRLVKIVQKQSENIHEEIVQAMQQNVMTDSGVSGVRGRGGAVLSNASMMGGPVIGPFERTISASVNLLYLEALLATKRFEDYFGASLDLISSLPTSDFSLVLFKFVEDEGVPKLKLHINSLFTTATGHLQSIFQSTAAIVPGLPNPMTLKGLVQGSKLVRDAMILLVKSAAHIVQGQDQLKFEKQFVESLMRIMGQLTTIMLQLSAMLNRSFEHFEKQLGKGNTTTREWAQTVHDSLRDAARTFPLSVNKTRPTQSTEKAATGHTIHEEIFSTLDKLYRGFIKPDSGQSS